MNIGGYIDRGFVQWVWLPARSAGTTKDCRYLENWFMGALGCCCSGVPGCAELAYARCGGDTGRSE